MKKIIKISVMAFGICFIAGKANAQLASDQPAMTPAQIEQLRKVEPAATKTTTVQTASMQLPAGAAAGALKSAIKLIAVPSQGGVIVPTERPVSEIKVSAIPSQEEKVSEKKNN